MTPQQLRLAAADWRAVHESIHGDLSPQEAELVNEALSFVITCAQVEEGVTEPGTPFHSELIADQEETLP